MGSSTLTGSILAGKSVRIRGQGALSLAGSGQAWSSDAREKPLSLFSRATGRFVREAGCVN
jgi:hypothetical protein